MTTRTLSQFRTMLAYPLAARGIELRVLILAVLALLLLCGTLLPVGHDASVQQDTTWDAATSAAWGPLPIREETADRNPMKMALQSWGEPHGLR